jgi:adenine-specific DNA-methyltransferase
LLATGGKWARVNYPIVSQHPSETRSKPYRFRGREKSCGTNKQWRFSLEEGLPRLEKAGRLFDGGGDSLGGVVFWEDWNQVAQSNIWADIHGEKFPIYVVQTATKAVERCILMTTDPGDLVLDPTCGSGTTAYAAELWGRRWITSDTSRVALALARAHHGRALPLLLSRRHT